MPKSAQLEHGDETNLAPTLGEQIRAARRAAGWTVCGLARRSFLDPADLSRIENGRRAPWPGELAHLEGALGCRFHAVGHSTESLLPAGASCDATDGA